MKQFREELRKREKERADSKERKLIEIQEKIEN